MTWRRVLYRESARALEVALRTDCGKVRNINEDSIIRFGAGFSPGAEVFAVADGMGGYSAGEVASQTALERFQGQLSTRPKIVPSDSGWQSQLSEWLQQSVREVDAHVARLAGLGEGLSGMGTTLVALLLLDEWACVIHVGDSRAYRLRDGMLHQLTIDHTWGEGEALQLGGVSRQITEAPQRHHLVRSIGRGGDCRATVLWLHLRPGDLFLLCSDGLTAYVDGEELASALSDDLEIPEKTDALVALANHRGGGDNISVVLVKVHRFQSGSFVVPTTQTLDPQDFSSEILRMPRVFPSAGEPPWLRKGNPRGTSRILKAVLVTGMLLIGGGGVSLVRAPGTTTRGTAGGPVFDRSHGSTGFPSPRPQGAPDSPTTRSDSIADLKDRNQSDSAGGEGMKAGTG